MPSISFEVVHFARSLSRAELFIDSSVNPSSGHFSTDVSRSKIRQIWRSFSLLETNGRGADAALPSESEANLILVAAREALIRLPRRRFFLDDVTEDIVEGVNV